jgi:hypothetical protein
MEGSGQLHASTALPTVKLLPRYLLDMRLGGSQRRSGFYGERKIWPLLRIEYLASNSYPVAIPTELSRFILYVTLRCKIRWRSLFFSKNRRREKICFYSEKDCLYTSVMKIPLTKLFGKYQFSSGYSCILECAGTGLEMVGEYFSYEQPKSCNPPASGFPW